MIILTPSTSKRGECGSGAGHIFRWEEIPDHKSAMFIYLFVYLLYLYICIRTHDASCNFERIFMKFTWCGFTHRWTLLFFGNNRPNRTTDMGEAVPPKPAFRLSFNVYGFTCFFLFFLRKHLKTVSGTSFPTEKVIFIFVVRRPFPSKMVVSPKIIFCSYSGKYYFFRKNCWMENILNLLSYKKNYINFCWQTTLPPQNGHNHLQMVVRSLKGHVP